MARLPFTMAEGPLAGPVCAPVAWMAQDPARRRILCLTSALAAVSTVVDLSLPPGNVSGTALAPTPRAALHALASIGGGVTSGRVPWAVAAGPPRRVVELDRERLQPAVKLDPDAKLE